MKMRSALNNGFLFLSLGAVFVGLVKVDRFHIQDYAAFLLFFVFFRIKMWLDDAVYFHKAIPRNRFFDLGVVCAVIAWSLWAIAGYTIKNIEQSYAYAMWSIVFLSFWIVCDALDQGSFGEGRPSFLAFNLIYIAVLAVTICDGCPVPFPKKYLAYVLVVGTVTDFVFTGSLKHFSEEFSSEKYRSASDRSDSLQWLLALAVFSLVPLLLLLIVLQTWFTAPGADPGPSRNEHRYGAIVDAGSSGSRLAIFEWGTAADGGPDVRQIASVEDMELNNRPKCPLTNLPKPGTRACDCLVDLSTLAREKALLALGGSHLPPIPLWVKATAGVRKERPPDQAKILEATDGCLAARSGYAWRGAEVISGATEGVYAWLAVNHLAHTLQAEAAEATHGIVELGRQSAQIAYRVSGPTWPSPTLGEIVTVSLASKDLHVYSVSDLLGKDAFGPPSRECAPDRDPKNCIQNQINPFLCSKVPVGQNCPNKVQSLFLPNQMHFVGLSNFVHVARNTGLGRDATLKDVLERANVICGPGQKRKDVRDEILKLVPQEYRDAVCFDAFYATHLANYGWSIPLEKVSLPDSRWAGDPSSPLGAMIFEVARSTSARRH